MTDHGWTTSGSSSIDVQQLSLKCLPGCRFGLSQPTAVIHLTLKGRVTGLRARLGKLAELAPAMMPDEPLYLAPPQSWPGAFLMDGGVENNGSVFLLLAEWFAATSVLMQRYARLPVGWGKVLSASRSGLSFAVPWYHKELLKEALRHAVRWVLIVLSTPPLRLAEAHAQWQEGFIQWLDRVRPAQMGLNTQRFALAALNEGYPVAPIAQDTLQIGWGRHSRWIESSMNEATSGIAMRLARNKWQTGRRLADMGIPVPRTLVAKSIDGLAAAVETYGYPLVVKPTNQDAAKGVTVNIQQRQELTTAFEAALELSANGALIQPFMAGTDHRLLVVNGECLMASIRHPASVTGDGKSTVQELIDIANRHPFRGTRKHSTLKNITLDDDSYRWLEHQALTLESVPEAGRFVRLRSIPNMTTAGVHENVTDSVHPDNKALAVAAAKAVRLNVAGIDMLCPDIRRSWHEVGATVIEVNGQPDVSLHWTMSPEANIYRQMMSRMDIEGGGRIPVLLEARPAGSTACADLWEKTLALGESVVQRVEAGDDGFKLVQRALTDATTGAIWATMNLEEIAGKGFPCDVVDISLLSVADGKPDQGVMAACVEAIARTRKAIVVDANLLDAVAARLKDFAGDVVVVDADQALSPGLHADWGRVTVKPQANGGRLYAFVPGKRGLQRGREIDLGSDHCLSDRVWIMALAALTGRFDLLGVSMATSRF
ncbi:ATP-grasp domain-containing protein [Halomonas tibetensis]|uniref:ATP-grasp domain-containing protein n=1 Tax=Halomonas tibetensis TaxID=2259590 RepID=A0ABV7B516_9GAMM